MSITVRFPFTAVVGHDDAKRALLLAAVDPRIGGVLLRGEKGAAKTTLARGLAALLPGDAPFVDLPLGATEDRVIGTLDVRAALTSGDRRFEPGLLAAANGGVLYIDEVNLLADHLVDALLDAAASGVNRIEREGISHEHPARFVLIGSMNPEEGELRPQLLDRFGLAVDVASPLDPLERALAVERRLAFDAEPSAFVARHRETDIALRTRLAAARPATLDTDLLRAISALCASMAVEGLRADIVIARGAAAHAGLDGRSDANANDVRAIAPLALAHRQRRAPFDQPGVARERLDEALAEALDGAPAPAEGETGDRRGTDDERVVPPGAVHPPPRLAAIADERAGGRRSPSRGRRGRLVLTRPHEPGDPVAVAATARATGLRRAALADPAAPADVQGAVREQKAGNLVVLAVDASGSMGVAQRTEATKGVVVGLLLDAYQRRDRVAVVSFRGEGAEVVLRPTGAVEVARARLGVLPTGGRTPLAAGIDAALGLARAGGATAVHRPLLVVITDGRATAGPDGASPFDAALAAAERVRRRGVAAVVVDAEDASAPGAPRLGLAATLATAMGARYLPLASFTADTLRSMT
jgi:magnesium chelatase subunit D